jgi:hypothetical protein
MSGRTSTTSSDRIESRSQDAAREAPEKRGLRPERRPSAAQLGHGPIKRRARHVPRAAKRWTLTPSQQAAISVSMEATSPIGPAWPVVADPLFPEIADALEVHEVGALIRGLVRRQFELRLVLSVPDRRRPRRVLRQCLGPTNLDTVPAERGAIHDAQSVRSAKPCPAPAPQGATRTRIDRGNTTPRRIARGRQRPLLPLLRVGIQNPSRHAATL